MASITWSGIGITEGRGKSGQKIYSRNRGGNYEKEYVAPFYPNSDSQQILAQSMADVTALWQSLDDASRHEWIMAAQKDPRKNTLGKHFKLSGFNLFASQTFNILLGGGVPTLLPAAKRTVRLPTAIIINALDPTTLNVTLQIAGGGIIMPNNLGLILYGTGSLSSGIMSKKSGFTGFYGRFPGNALTNQDVFNEYQQLLGTPITGEKIFFRARCYHQLSGQASRYLYTSAIVS